LELKIENFLDGQLFVYFSPISHLEASDTETVQSKDVWNENLEYLRWSAVCLLSGVCSLFSNKPLRGFRVHTLKLFKAKMLRMKILNFSLGQLFVHFQLFIYFPEISHLEALSTETTQTKDFWNRYFESNHI